MHHLVNTYINLNNNHDPHNKYVLLVYIDHDMMEDKVRMTMTNTDTRSSQKTSFINNVQTNTIADETVQERQSLSKALKPKTDN